LECTGDRASFRGRSIETGAALCRPEVVGKGEAAGSAIDALVRSRIDPRIGSGTLGSAAWEGAMRDQLAYESRRWIVEDCGGEHQPPPRNDRDPDALMARLAPLRGEA